jgi:hypothetical protein
MRRILAAAAVSVLWGCHPTINFDVQSSTSAQILGGSVSVPFNNVTLPASTIDLATQSGFSSAQTAKDRIQSARLKKLTISIPQPQSGQDDLSFLSSLTIQIGVPGSGGPPNAQIAHLASAQPPGTTTVDLVIDDVELAPYVQASTFTVSTTVSGTTPRRTETLRGDLTLNIEASVF